jgi:CheY-like chemotaxis protein
MRENRDSILIVEDSEAARLMLSTFLEVSGYKVYAATNGLEAIDLAVKLRPDLVLMDLLMPELNGLAATRMLRSVRELKNTPVIALSGYDPRDHEGIAIKAGCSGYLRKPVNLDELKGAISDLLSMKRNKTSRDISGNRRKLFQPMRPELP